LSKVKKRLGTFQSNDESKDVAQNSESEFLDGGKMLESNTSNYFNRVNYKNGIGIGEREGV
jgi:hypothetical protein